MASGIIIKNSSSLVENCLNLLDKGKIKKNSRNSFRKSMISKHNAEIVKKFVRELLIKDKEMTVYNYFYSIHAYGEFLKNKRFEDIGRDDFIAYQSHLSCRRDFRSSGKEKNIVQSTVNLHLARMKKFHKWLNNGRNPDWLNDIEITSSGTRLDPDQILTEEDVKKLIETADNPRDKAVVSMLYELGARIGEFYKVKLSDLHFDEYGVVVKIETGKIRKNKAQEFRKIRVVNSVPYLKIWLRYHPNLKHLFGDKNVKKDCSFYNTICKENENWLWVSKVRSIFSQERYDRMENFAISETLKELGERANIKKRVNPHSFRHARATYLASKIPESVLRKTMGWTADSNMTKVYVHLNDTDVDNVILDRIYNTQTKKLEEAVEQLRPKICNNCGENNPADYGFCMKCNFPLNEEDIRNVEKKAITIALTPELIGQMQKLRILRESRK